MKSKRYTSFGKYMTYATLGYTAFTVFLGIYLIAFDFPHVNAGRFLQITYGILFSFVLVMLWISGIYRQVLHFTRISSQGFTCYSPFLGKYEIPWSTVHTYGLAAHSVSYLNMVILFFSQDAKELWPKDRKMLNRITRTRIIFQYRKDFVEDLQRYMPEDMWKNLEDCFSHSRTGFFKR